MAALHPKRTMALMSAFDPLRTLATRPAVGRARIYVWPLKVIGVVALTPIFIGDDLIGMRWTAE
jgi:hypothetical protein